MVSAVDPENSPDLTTLLAARVESKEILVGKLSATLIDTRFAVRFPPIAFSNTSLRPF